MVMCQEGRLVKSEKQKENNMTRFYYDDPLIAAYMEKHFNVNFSDRHGERVLSCFNNQYEGYFYIHPDSYDVFKPMIGDGFSIIKDKYGVLHCDTIKHIYCEYVVEGYSCEVDISNINIIQRNGNQFFMPKEDA